jgi:hypothetical protein
LISRETNRADARWSFQLREDLLEVMAGLVVLSGNMVDTRSGTQLTHF